MGKPTRPTGGEQHLSPPFKRQSLLEVSELDQGNTRNVSRPQLPRVHLSPLRWGKTVGLRTSVSQIQASAVLPQSEANLALGFQRQDDGCHGRTEPGERTARRARTRQRQQGMDTGRQLRMMRQRRNFGHGSDLNRSRLSCL